MGIHTRKPVDALQKRVKQAIHIHTSRTVLTDICLLRQPKKKAKRLRMMTRTMMILSRRLSTKRVFASMMLLSIFFSQSSVALASTITPFQDVEEGFMGVGQDLLNDFGGGIEVEKQFNGPVDQNLQGLLEGTVSEADFLESGRRLQADFGDAANVAKDILKIVTGTKTIGQDIADAPTWGRRLQADFGDAANVAKDILKIVTGAKTIGQDIADAPTWGRRL